MKKPRKKSRSVQRPESDNSEATNSSGADILEALPDDAPEEVKLAVMQSATFVGPLPPPVLFEHYNEVVPGAAERILAMAEKEQDHRHSWEKDEQKIESSANTRGVLLGATLAVLFAVGALYGTYLENIWIVALFLGMGALGIVTKLVDGRTAKGTKQPDKKNK